MTPILLKDLRRLLPELAVLVVFEIASILSLALQAPQLSPQMLMTLAFAVSLVGGFVFSFRSVATEEAGRGIAFLLSLPISPEQIVLAKFAANLLLVTLNFVLVWGGSFIYCHLALGLPAPSPDLAILLWLLQCLNSSLYLAAALAFSAARAIWLPFPLLFVAINVAVNWQAIAARLPTALTHQGAWPWTILLAVLLLAMYLATRHAYAGARVRREWA